MKTSFGFFSSDVVAIRDWHQLLNVDSKIENIVCAVNDISDDICSGMSITIYNKLTNFDYITFFVEGNNSKEVDLSELVISNEEAVKILNAFGFPIIYIVEPNIDANTKNVLTALNNLGFGFICRNNKNIIYASQWNDTEKILSTGAMVTEIIPASIDCDFTFMKVLTVYSIEDLLSIN